MNDNVKDQYKKLVKKTFQSEPKKILLVNENSTKKKSTSTSSAAPNKKGHINIVIQVEEFLKLHYDLRFNEVSNRVEERKKGATDWKDLNDSNIYRFLLHNDFNISQAKLTAILRSDFVEVHNPFKNYFDGLKPFNKHKEPDYINNLCSYIHLKDQERFNAQLKKHLVRTVLCAIDSNYYNKQSFILVHDQQNSGKSTLCRWFCPPQLERYLGENVNLTNKDGEIALSEKFIINLDELAALSKYEINQLKSVMSRDRISVRRPFERSTSEAPRRCSFFGSTNRTEFLFDETGSVRWLCFEIDKIDWDYKKIIDINRLWAQAYELLNKTDFKYDLTAVEISENERANDGFFMTTPEEDLLHKMFSPGDEKKHDKFLSATGILQAMQENCNNAIKLNVHYLGRVLHKNGYIKTSVRLPNTSQPTKGYYIKFV